MTVEATALTKRYRSGTLAVDAATFTVEKGEVLGLLGNNGAGKSTTIGMLTTRITPSSGTARIDGLDVNEQPVLAKRCLGVAAQSNTLDRQLTARSVLAFHLRYFGWPRREADRRADELLEAFDLLGSRDTKALFLSGGTARRLMIARAVAHRPSVLFLDEPSAGLDVHSRFELIQHLRQLTSGGTTTLLTTHDMAEAEQLCDRLCVMVGGRIVHEGTAQELRDATTSRSEVRARLSQGAVLLADRLRSLPDVVCCDEVTDGVSVSTAAPEQVVRHIFAVAEAEDLEVVDLAINQPTLESVLMELTKPATGGAS
ncbi:MAG: daunorubicin resistance transporter ATP-binding subunit [Acidimicrobiales bacterium]|nr:daunorubicin resistance transporter ATP-binding subunit [Acidimicrobiales bacterium]